MNDAFGAAHRAHASTAGVAEFLPAYAGLLLAREVETLTGMLADPERPFVAILGGSKVSDKFGVIDRLIDVLRRAAHRRRHGFTFLVAKGIEVGKSIVEADWVEPAKKMLAKAAEQGRRPDAARRLRGRRRHRRGRRDQHRRPRGDSRST